MLSQEDANVIAEIAARYDVEQVLLFGSSADLSRNPRDIDLAVEGIDPASFFRFYGDLLFGLSKPVDLIDLSRDTKFARIVRQEGTPVYVRSQGSGRR